jgi:hypothetical protein
MLSELQLQLCDIQGRLFELSLTKNLDSANFITLYMKSRTAADYGLKYNRFQWAGEEYLLEELMDEFKEKMTVGEMYSKDELFWIGYTYSYWHILTGESSKNILKQAPAKLMKKAYLGLHTVAMELAIEDLKELAKNEKSNLKH